MSDPLFPPERGWFHKFRDAFRGLLAGSRRQNSFAVHVPVAIAVVAVAAWVGVTRVEWCLLAACIFLVLTAELFNSSLETLAKAIDRHYNPYLADGLNIASAAVLLSSLGAVVVGLLVLGPRLYVVFWG